MQKGFEFFSILILASIVLSACGPTPSANLAKSSLTRDTNPSVPQSDLCNSRERKQHFRHQSLRGASFAGREFGFLAL